MTGSLDRRGFLTIGAAGAAGFLVAGCSSDDDVATANSTTTTASPTTAAAGSGGGTATTVASGSAVGTELTAADFASLGTCLLMTEKTAGPFPLDEQFDRRDITEGSEGHPLRLGLRVLDEGCAAISGAKVEIWHCDATGDDSAFIDNGGGKDDGPGTTFLRGTQTANDEGIVEFATIYPGWYSGRAVHIHLRVHIDDETVLSSQLFFDADDTATVYEEGPYSDHGLPDTSNEADSIAGDVVKEGSLLVTTALVNVDGDAGMLGLLNLGVDPSARSSESGGRGPSGT